MSQNTWDPLESNYSSELASAAIKRQIKNILKSYTGWFDPFSEMVQNALDAVEKRKRREPDYTPEIWINIDLQSNSISVTDNGIGFQEDEFKFFLAPNVSFKKIENRGNKGVGATYLAYGFNFLQIGTKTSQFEFIGTLKDGRIWVEDDSGTITRPKVYGDEQPIHQPFLEIDKGSTFTLTLNGEHVRPKDLSWISATTAEQWSVILRLKTPLGGIYSGNSCVLSKCNLSVKDYDGKETSKIIANCQYLYPHEVFPASKKYNDLLSEIQKLTARGRDFSHLPASYKRLDGLYSIWSKDDILNNFTYTDAEKELIEEYSLSCYSYLGYSTDIYDKYNDDVIKLRKGMRLLRGGLQLATNNMPQGELLVIPLTRNIGYQNVTHIIIHFNGAEPDLGRKGFQPELEELAKRISVDITKKLLAWKRLLKKETGAPPDVIAKRNAHDWIKSQEQHEESHPLVISRKDVFLPMLEPSITSEPLNEQDVVSLFNQLLAGGVIRGLKIMSTSQHNQYDGIIRYILKDPVENHIFDLSANPLGIDGNQVNPFESAPAILEYKYTIDALIDEFEKEDKNEADINLVVAWEIGDKWEKRYDVISLLDLDNIHHRFFHGCTHIFQNSLTGDTAFYGIILKELIDYINDPLAVQELQKKYSDA